MLTIPHTYFKIYLTNLIMSVRYQRQDWCNWIKRSLRSSWRYWTRRTNWPHWSYWLTRSRWT